uniref:Variant surface glycoprotein n=1 Tax=Trypanosoma brucei TaxID=5691 RepID=A0A1V0FY47_9TRYP|nr:variant surface glycoprotein [Trypanosoma brucei]
MDNKLPWVLLVALTILHAAHRVKANDTNAKNMAIFNDICDLIAVATGSTDHIPEPALETTVINNLETINMSLADANWRATIPNEGTPEANDPQACKQSGADPTCKETYKAWVKSKKNIETESNLPKNTKLTPDNLKSVQAQIAATTLPVLIAKARHVKAVYDINIKKTLEYVKQGLNSDVNTALYGKATAVGPNNGLCDITPVTSRESTCKINKQAKALCVAAVCVCGEHSTQSGKICEGNLAVTVTDWTATSLKTPFGTIKDKCDKVPKRQLTSQALTSAIDKLLSKTQTRNANDGTEGIYIGVASTSAATCAESNNAGCIDLTPLAAAKASEALTDDSFITKLRAVAANVQKAEQAAGQKLAVEAALKKIQAEAHATYLQVALSKPPAAAGSSPSKPPKTTQECDAITKAADCKNNGNCKWTKETEETGKHCKLNTTRVEQQATKAGTGAAGGAAATGCATQKDKTARENEKAGDKHNCAWRKGKDNEPEPEK